MKLNLGAGTDIRAGWVNLDVVDLPGIDVVHDLDVVPWPLGDNEFDEILALDIFEHVGDPLGFMAECWRVLRHDGMLTVRSPHYGTWCAHTDPTHRRAVSEATFDYWVPGTTLYMSFGDAYSRGRHFGKQPIRREGDNVVFTLHKIGEKGVNGAAHRSRSSQGATQLRSR